MSQYKFLDDEVSVEPGPSDVPTPSVEFHDTLLGEDKAVAATRQKIRRTYKRRARLIGILLLVCGALLVLIDALLEAMLTLPLRFQALIVWPGLLCLLTGSVTVLSAYKQKMSVYLTTLVLCIVTAVFHVFVAIGNGWEFSVTYSFDEHPDARQTRLVVAGIFVRLMIIVFGIVTCIVQSSFCCNVVCCRRKAAFRPKRINYTVNDDTDSRTEYV